MGKGGGAPARAGGITTGLTRPRHHHHRHPRKRGEGKEGRMEEKGKEARLGKDSRARARPEPGPAHALLQQGTSSLREPSESSPGRPGALHSVRERPGALQSVRERPGAPQRVRVHSESAPEHTNGIPERWRASESSRAPQGVAEHMGAQKNQLLILFMSWLHLAEINF